MEAYPKRGSNLTIFIFLIVIVVLIHIFLLKPVLSTGFESDDWTAILYIKTNPANIFEQFFNLWTKVGTHHAGQYIYIGTLFNNLGFNYPSYNNVNIILKILATLTIFPLVLLIFKNRTLAFLTTIIHSISYSSTGALTYMLQGVFYLGIIFMNIFFIFYYWAVNKNSKFCILVASLSLALSYVLAAGRIYPIFALILIIETFLLFRFGMKTLFMSIVRVISFLTPIFILLLIGSRNIPYVDLQTTPLQSVINGNLYLLLLPLSGLGYLFLPASFSGSGHVFRTLLGGLLIILSYFFFWKWRKNTEAGEKGLLQLAASAGILFSLVFMAGTWLFVGKALFLFDVYGGINRYFTFPSLGFSLFIGAILTLFLQNTSRKSNFAKSIGLVVVFLILLVLYQLSNKEIEYGFGQINSSSHFLLRNSYLHKRFQENFMTQIPVERLKNEEPVFFYFELPSDKKEYYEKALDLHDMQRWFYLRLGFKGNKCIEIVDDENKLNEAIGVKQGINKLIPVEQRCISMYTGLGSPPSEKGDTPYNIQNFYAFRIQEDQFINITQEIVNKLQLD